MHDILRLRQIYFVCLQDLGLEKTFTVANNRNGIRHKKKQATDRSAKMMEKYWNRLAECVLLSPAVWQQGLQLSAAVVLRLPVHGGAGQLLAQAAHLTRTVRARLVQLGLQPFNLSAKNTWVFAGIH